MDPAVAVDDDFAPFDEDWLRILRVAGVEWQTTETAVR